MICVQILKEVESDYIVCVRVFQVTSNLVRSNDLDEKGGFRSSGEIIQNIRNLKQVESKESVMVHSQVILENLRAKIIHPGRFEVAVEPDKNNHM